MVNKLTPWEVEGHVDYDALIKQFGTKRIDDKMLSRLEKLAPLHVMLRRGYYYSHRDLDLALNDVEKGKPVFLYTGRAPAGAMHIGHLMSFLITKWFQEAFDCNLYIQVPDEEKFLVKKELTLEQTDEMVQNDVLEIAAMGFNPDKTFLFTDREYARHLYEPAVRIAKRITYSTAKAVFGLNNESNIGWSFYPAMQNVPCFFEKNRCVIPCAIDQDPFFRLQRDLAEGFGYPKTTVVHSKFLSPLQGADGKMSSSSASTAIYLSDDAKTVTTKINKHAFSGGQPTIEEHRKKGANLAIDVPFNWLSAFFEPDDEKLAHIAEEYGSGRMLTGEVKKYLADKINAFLADHQYQKKHADKALNQMKYDGELAQKMWKTIPMSNQKFSTRTSHVTVNE